MAKKINQTELNKPISNKSNQTELNNSELTVPDNINQIIPNKPMPKLSHNPNTNNPVIAEPKDHYDPKPVDNTKPVPKKGTRSWVPNPQKNFGEENVKPGDNARYLRYAMESLNLPPLDLADPVAVEQRIFDYFNYCIENDRKPNMIGMGNWLGCVADTVNSWKKGIVRESTHSEIIKKAIQIFEELWVDYMQNGKINPASGIFLAKNMFGYKDTQDVVIQKVNPLGDEPDKAKLESFLNELPDATEYEVK